MHTELLIACAFSRVSVACHSLLSNWRKGDAARDESREEGLELQLLSASNAALPAWLGLCVRHALHKVNRGVNDPQHRTEATMELPRCLRPF